ncbi:type IV secretion system protein [Caulobacter sp.]|uniref:type IV secretion system protein n=1 Tax=Caulobacter sp. TaxID=78 RepID=UPI001B2D4469|nr:type IV secretion system protein [Caulobacter sp.]MBO9547033.1 type IV secretion system protein [Caulobacter sp.]
MATCAQLPVDAPMVQGLIGSVDCRVHELATSGYAALAGPGSPVAMLLTGLMTLYVVFIGYRLMLGRGGLRVGDATMSVLKVGIVVALATNWPFFQTLVYDTLTKAPAEIGGLLLGQDAHPFLALQDAFDGLQKSATLMASRASVGAAATQGGPGFGAFAVNTGGMTLVLSSLGVLLASKVVLAMLLALAPLIAGLLLFETTRGLVEGWLKAMIALALIPLTATLTLSLELAMLAPSLKALGEARSAQQFAAFDIGPAVTVLVLTLVFALVMVLSVITLGVIAAGLRLPRGLVGAAWNDVAAAPQAPRYATSQVEPLSRAATVAAAAVALDRRDAPTSPDPIGPRLLTVVSDRGPAAQAAYAAPGAPLGQTYRRTPAPRRAASGARRDQ